MVLLATTIWPGKAPFLKDQLAAPEEFKGIEGTKSTILQEIAG
jgi:hypothetical protein